MMCFNIMLFNEYKMYKILILEFKMRNRECFEISNILQYVIFCKYCYMIQLYDIIFQGKYFSDN